MLAGMAMGGAAVLAHRQARRAEINHPPRGRFVTAGETPRGENIRSMRRGAIASPMSGGGHDRTQLRAHRHECGCARYPELAAAKHKQRQQRAATKICMSHTHA